MWHPFLPLIVSIDFYGQLYIWEPTRKESWDKLFCGFTELEENVEYKELEEEFDIVLYS